MLQALTLIERLAKKDIGFTCWKLFTINYFRSYEVCYKLYSIDHANFVYFPDYFIVIHPFTENYRYDILQEQFHLIYIEQANLSCSLVMCIDCIDV